MILQLYICIFSNIQMDVYYITNIGIKKMILHINIRDSIHQKLKILAAKRNTTMKELIEGAILTMENNEKEREIATKEER